MRDALGAVQSILVLGGTSEIGLAIASELAADRRATVVLAGRDEAAMRAAGTELEGVAGKVETVPFDAAAPVATLAGPPGTDPDAHDRVIQQAAELAGGDIDVIIVAFGLLGDQARDEAGGPGAVQVATVNYVGAVSAGLAAARLLRRQGHGALVALSSVAGERVRRANFIYGSSKAGMDGFFQGLADSLVGSGARVLIVRPGFVHSRMTAGLPAAPFATTPQAVAAATAAALRSGRTTVWVPAVLQVVFAGFRHLPRQLWRMVPG